MYENIIKHPFIPDKEIKLSDECLDLLNRLFEK